MRHTLEPHVLNGAHGEGGGALLRTALSVSCLTQQPVRIHSIRGAMRKPGLNSEDLTFLAALSASCRADVEGDDLESREILFHPRRSPQPLNMNLDVHSHEKGLVPGNALTIAESLLPVLARTGGYSNLTITGETHNNNTLTYDAFERVTLAAHRRQGLYAFPSLLTAGYGFGGRGEVALEVEPSAVEPITLSNRRGLLSCSAVITGSEIHNAMLEDAKARVEKRFEDARIEGEVETVLVRGRSTGLSITVWAEFEGGIGCGSATMQRGMNLIQTIDRAWNQFYEWFVGDSTVDPYLADQLLLPAVLAEGRSTFRTQIVTRRLQTMAFVIKQFLPIRITILGREGEPGTVTIER